MERSNIDVLKPVLLRIQTLPTPVSFAAIAVFSFAIYVSFGVEGFVGRDYGIYLYSAQEVLRGNPHFVGVFDHKGPVGVLVGALGMSVGRLFSMHDVHSARLAYALFCSLIPAFLFLLTTRATRSRVLGVLAALAFLSFAGFSYPAANGLEPKSIMVVALSASLYFAASNRWGLASFSGAVAGLSWQVTLVLPVFAVVAVWLHRHEIEFWKTVSRIVVGGLVPVVAIVAYYAARGGLAEFVDGMVGFNLNYLERESFTIAEKLREIASAVYQHYRLSFAAIVIGGLGMAGYAYHSFVSDTARNGHGRAGMRFVSVSFLFFLAFFLYDTPGWRDLYVLLPYLALGFGYAVFMVTDLVRGADADRRRVRHSLTFILGITLLLAAGFDSASYTSRPLREQMARFGGITARYGSDLSVASFGMPQFLAITGLRNWSPFVFTNNGVDLYIDAHYPGGYESWVESAARANPDVIAVERGTVFVPADHEFPIRSWERQAPILRDILGDGYRYEPEYSTEQIAVYVREDIGSNRR